ncbi:LysR family transcriptional regulator [Pontibacterium sp. N1Y112]|uniref:LysR family transcriptional regulator n=1 Tax=Pontibacterium sinense TaxID=2781979 RepID=A0A8J7K5P2_9GAMM|nr:LysR family transcriptional regulator [Pontibacterium sinense]MBE9395831.1 LysR family transcriptional regulator [Pontibacterium sinense]
MDIKPLRYFQAIAEASSFTKAAEQLHVAQPAISMAIKKLEAELDLTLFHRHERQISLTDEGKKLLLHSRRILRAIDDARLEMEELKGLTKGEVRVGIPSMLGSYYFPPILMAFRHRYPELDLSVIEGGTWQLQQMLERSELDLAIIVADVLPQELHARTFLREQMLVTVAKDHPLAQQAAVSYDDFFREELVMFKEGYFHRKVVDRLAARTECTPNISFETNLIPLIKAIVNQGFGISTLLGMVIEEDPDLIGLPFEEPVWLDLSIAWRRDGYLSRANQAFVDFLLEHS